MNGKVFGRLKHHFQIPDNMPFKKGDIGEKCYDEKSSKVGFYETTFITELLIPLSLSTLLRRLASYLGVSVSQLTSNALRIFIRAEVLWGLLGGRNCSLTW